MPRLNPMGSIWNPSDVSGSGAPDTRVFIQCIKGREPMANELWYHGFDCLCRDVRPTARLDIPPGTFRSFITEYITADGTRIQTIGKNSVNGSVQFTGFREFWGSSFPYISNTFIPDTNRRWGWNGTDINSTSSTSSVIWGRTIDASPDYSLMSSDIYHVVQSHNHDKFLH